MNVDVALDNLRRTFLQLSPAHYHTLKYLIAHLHRYRTPTYDDFITFRVLYIIMKL